MSLVISALLLWVTVVWAALAVTGVTPVPPEEWIGVLTLMIGVLWGEVLFS